MGELRALRNEISIIYAAWGISLAVTIPLFFLVVAPVERQPWAAYVAGPWFIVCTIMTLTIFIKLKNRMFRRMNEQAEANDRAYREAQWQHEQDWRRNHQQW